MNNLNNRAGMAFYAVRAGLRYRIRYTDILPLKLSVKDNGTVK